LFLDEIGDAPASLQPMLLRALQEREIQVVGGVSQRVDLRVISAMEHDPEEPGQGLRPALRHRLGALEIRLPRLRDRLEDIGLLAAAELSSHWSRSPPGSGSTARDGELASWARCFELLYGYHWPGNVRELQHVVRQISASSARGLSIPAPLMQRLRTASGEAHRHGEPPGEVQDSCEPPRRFADVSDEEFIEAWREERFEVAALARRFGVSRPAIYRRLKGIPECRLAADVPLGELLAVLDACRGDLASTAKRLAVSQRGLEARLRATGVRSAADARVKDRATDAGGG
jgi:two-component system nitrogen regulation response regulator GlnG